MANGRTKRGFITYRSYMFKEKDPIIDALRTVVEDSKKSYTEINQKSDVSVSTMYNWFHGKTQRPQFSTVTAVALSLGKKGVVFRNGKPSFTE